MHNYKQSLDSCEVLKSRAISIEIIDLIQVKKEFEKNVTSTFLNKKESSIYLQQGIESYYSFYTLLRDFQSWMEGPEVLVGELVVFNFEKPWMYDSPSDRFIEITAYNPGIKVFGDIEVGSHENQIEMLFGESIEKYNDFLIFNNPTENLIAIFKIKSRKATWLRAGYYNTEIISDIEKSMPILTKGSKRR